MHTCIQICIYSFIYTNMSSFLPPSLSLTDHFVVGKGIMQWKGKRDSGGNSDSSWGVRSMHISVFWVLFSHECRVVGVLLAHPSRYGDEHRRGERTDSRGGGGGGRQGDGGDRG